MSENYLRYAVCSLNIYSAFTGNVKDNCHLPTPGWNCMTHRQGLQGLPDVSLIAP